jgi:eukaryotic-like serine/threonine-protein kinase
MLQANSILQNRYRLISQVGKGGMGAVYVAKDENLGITVAVKQNLFSEPRLIEAFKREARLLASLRHPALPQVKDHFITDDLGQFLVMEFIAGDDLETILEKRRQKLAPEGQEKPFEVEQVSHWAEQLLDALDYLHTLPEPVIHRDIKPQNLKLAGRNQIILLDFGLAKGQPAQMTRVASDGSLYGYTPNYAPIEQIRGVGTDPRSDLYALGATLYHLLTGVLPVDAATRADIFLGGEIDPLRPAHELNPQVPKGFSEVLMKAMEQHRNNRPASAAEMLKLLRAARQSMSLAPQAPADQVPTVLDTEAGRIRQETAQRNAGQEQQAPNAMATRPAAHLTTPQPQASQPLTPRITGRGPDRRANKKWLLIGGIALLGAALAVMGALLITRQLNKKAAAENQPRTNLPSVGNAGILPPPGLEASQVSMSDDGQTVVGACGDSKIHLWQLNITREFAEKVEYGASIALSHDGKTVVTGDQRGMVTLWRASDGQQLHFLGGHGEQVFRVGFSLDDQRFYSISNDKVILWRVSDGTPVQSLFPPEENFKPMAVSPDLKLMGFYHRDGKFKLWSITEDSFLLYLDGTIPPVTCAAFSRDGKLLAIGGDAGEVQLWQTEDGRLRQTLGKFGLRVASLALSADGKRVAAGLADGNIQLWNRGDGDSFKTLDGHASSVESLSFSADGKRLASGGWDQARVWNLEP